MCADRSRGRKGAKQLPSCTLGSRSLWAGDGASNEVCAVGSASRDLYSHLGFCLRIPEDLRVDF